MNQIADFFSRLLLAENWPPRWRCGSWTDFHGWLYIISDLTIWAAYFAIPIFLFRFITKKKDIPLTGIFWLFVAFIFLCGLTHLMDAIMFYWPGYRLNALIRFITACASWGTVMALFKIFPHALKLKTSGEFEIELANRREIEIKLKDAQKETEAHSENLTRKNAELEQFTYIVSHDLQEPLTTISAIISLLQKDASGNKIGDAERQEYISYVLGATNRMKSLIAHLLEYARLGEKSTVSEIDCNKLVSGVVADLDAKIRESGAVINIGNLPVIEGYEIEMRLLFQNLISNALKFMKKDDTAPQIHISAKQEDEGYTFAIKDNGIGIKPKYFDKIFQVFQRLNAHTDYDGTGIGLAHSKKIIDLHKGKIWVESEYGIGSTFYFTIPLKQ